MVALIASDGLSTFAVGQKIYQGEPASVGHRRDLVQQSAGINDRLAWLQHIFPGAKFWKSEAAARETVIQSDGHGEMAMWANVGEIAMWREESGGLRLVAGHAIALGEADAEMGCPLDPGRDPMAYPSMNQSGQRAGLIEKMIAAALAGRVYNMDQAAIVVRAQIASLLMTTCAPGSDQPVAKRRFDDIRYHQHWRVDFWPQIGLIGG